MKIIIYGAGGVGSIVGGLLWQNGQESVLIGREGHVKSINNHGLKVVTPSGTSLIRVPAVTSPDKVDFKPDDVVFLCMKGQNTEDAIRELHVITKDVPIFCFQNGVRNEEIAAVYFPRVYGVKVNIGAEYLTDGEVFSGMIPPGRLVIGRYPCGIDELCHEIADKLKGAGFMVTTSLDVMSYKWGKLLVNLNNAIEAITGCHHKYFESKKEFNLIAEATSREFKELLTKAGISWTSEKPPVAESNQPPRKTMAANSNHSSTWQSLARQQGTVETDFLNGEMVRLARKLGLRAPVNEKLLQITEEMALNHEKPGKYTLSQLCSLLGLEA